MIYRRIAPRTGKTDHQLIGILYVGAALITVGMAAPSFQWTRISAITWRQGWILLYPGLVASGFGFFLFNAGTRRTNIGTLAIFNNEKALLGVLSAGLVFHEKRDWPRLLAGGAVIAVSWILNEYRTRLGNARIASRR